MKRTVCGLHLLPFTKFVTALVLIDEFFVLENDSIDPLWSKAKGLDSHQAKQNLYVLCTSMKMTVDDPVHDHDDVDDHDHDHAGLVCPPPGLCILCVELAWYYRWS